MDYQTNESVSRVSPAKEGGDVVPMVRYLRASLGYKTAKSSWTSGAMLFGVIVIVIAIATAVVSTPDTISAQGVEVAGAAPWGPTNGGTYFADDKYHTHVTIETNAADRTEWQWRFDGPGGEDNYEPTDLDFFKVAAYNSSVDVYWYVTFIDPMYAALYDCKAKSSPTRCDRARIRINETAENLSELLQNNLVCHELGHTVGFGDGGTAGASCMTGGDNNQLAWWEIQTINSKY